ncbi:MAG: hypothetical protein JWR74_3219 [Polaromonas sp.]|nr:hypothetical protein [Polaromonas sp.]
MPLLHPAPRCTDPECCYHGQASADSCACAYGEPADSLLCLDCSGSGEGGNCGATCRACKGMGEVAVLV